MDAKCHGDNLPENWWRDKDLLQQEYHAHKSWRKVRAAHPDNCVTVRTFTEWWHNFDLGILRTGPKPVARNLNAHGTDTTIIDYVRSHSDATVEELADHLNVPPKRIREVISDLTNQGYRIDEDGGHVFLNRVKPDKNNLHTNIFSGSHIRFGVVSDTHLNSAECALEELHLAYNKFVDEEISTVLHAGDIGAGLGIYRSQSADLLNHTIDNQIRYIVNNYPKRDGITTTLIGGNHDLDGVAARSGIDIASAASKERDDLNYVGEYSAWIKLGDDETSPWVHLLHGSGGMSYAYSYKAQKLVQGYPAGRKPAVLIPGHWHVAGWIPVRGVNVLFPGCFEWASKFLERLGLAPTTGFYICDCTVGADGSLVRFRADWYPIYEGRIVA